MDWKTQTFSLLTLEANRCYCVIYVRALQDFPSFVFHKVVSARLGCGGKYCKGIVVRLVAWLATSCHGKVKFVEDVYFG